MRRPDFVTNEDIIRWSENVDKNQNISVGMKDNPIMREVLYAGLWLDEELSKLDCPPELIVRIQYTAGRISYKRDVWKIHQNMLQAYQENTLDYEEDPAELN